MHPGGHEIANRSTDQDVPWIVLARLNPGPGDGGGSDCRANVPDKLLIGMHFSHVGAEQVGRRERGGCVSRWKTVVTFAIGAGSAKGLFRYRRHPNRSTDCGQVVAYIAVAIAEAGLVLTRDFVGIFCFVGGFVFIGGTDRTVSSGVRERGVGSCGKCDTVDQAIADISGGGG